MYFNAVLGRDTMIVRSLVAVFMVILLFFTVYKNVSSKLIGQHTGIWAVKFKYSSGKSYLQMAEEFASQHGLANRGTVGVLRDTFEFTLPSDKVSLLHKRETLIQYEFQLSRDDQILWSEHQKALKRFRREVMFNDPNYGRQWHLVCFNNS